MKAPNLSDLVARDREQAEKLAALHAALDEGDASEIVDMTMEEIFAEARARNISAAA
jgi:antitoxin ParD1/3/4